MWDDKIEVLGYVGEGNCSDSDSDREDAIKESGDSDVIHIDDATDHAMVREKQVLNELVRALQQMKEDTTLPDSRADNHPSATLDTDDHHRKCKCDVRCAVASAIPPDAVSVSTSRDAKVQITGKMLQDWVMSPSTSTEGGEDVDDVDDSEEEGAGATAITEPICSTSSSSNHQLAEKQQGQGQGQSCLLEMTYSGA